MINAVLFSIPFNSSVRWFVGLETVCSTMKLIDQASEPQTVC